MLNISNFFSNNSNFNVLLWFSVGSVLLSQTIFFKSILAPSTVFVAFSQRGIMFFPLLMAAS